MRQKCSKDICELTFLQDFPQIFENNPRHIIKYIFDKYIDHTRMINEQRDILRTFTFRYQTEDGRIYKTVFSNHMQFRNDILMICHIHHLLFRPKYLRSKVLFSMISLMTIKYNIRLSDPTTITIRSVSQSYLSISMDLIYYNVSDLHDVALFLFPFFRLPVMIYAPMIISIFPMLENPPIAILIVIFLRVYSTFIPQIAPTISLLMIYEHIISYNINNMYYPEKIKLRLCIKYNIVVLEGDEFKFAPCFAIYRQKAKELISEMKPNDPNLEYILSLV